jgi:tight adherence protein B
MMGSTMGTLLLLGRALQASHAEGIHELVGSVDPVAGVVARFPIPALVRFARRPAGIASVAGVTLGWLGLLLAGGGGLVAGLVGGSASPFLMARRGRRRRSELLEGQVADLAESLALAVRSGLSVRQALEFSASEVEDPMRSSAEEALRSNALGAPLERAVSRWSADVGTDEARLLALVLTIHTRSGGDLATALEVVAGTIRHRISLRRELRAMSAQGRMSGAILGALPLVFFVVLFATSHAELAPVYRSSAGTAMVVSGLVLELLAYAWIRRILRVET